MKKLYMGVRLRRLREERNLTQQALADALGISLSYFNQIENNQRPLTLAILLRLNAAIGVEMQLFSDNDDARLVAELRAVLSDPALAEAISNTELRQLVANMPAVGRTIVDLHKRLARAQDEAAVLAARLGADRHDAGSAFTAAPFEEVRDFFYARHNYIDELDRVAEDFSLQLSARARLADALELHLRARHGIRLIEADIDSEDHLRRRFDGEARTITLPERLSSAQRAFQLATQLAFIEHGDLLDRQMANVSFANAETRALLRLGLANYFAGAVVLPYEPFRAAAENFRYDIDRLADRFGVGFETVCHRLSSLQRPGARGVPFFFIRVDRAGNISKRQSATDFHFSRAGGSCPLWNVYEAFTQPGRVVTQIAEMPDGRAYLWVARAITQTIGGYAAPGKTFAIALGCDLGQAQRLVYSAGLDLGDPLARTPIGVGCKICERPACPQRAFPSVLHPTSPDENSSRLAPYS